MSKEDFYKVWEDSTREDILNQYYYDYKFTRELCDKVNKAIEYMEDNTRYSVLAGMVEFYGSTDEVIDILKGKENEEN